MTTCQGCGRYETSTGAFCVRCMVGSSVWEARPFGSHGKWGLFERTRLITIYDHADAERVAKATAAHHNAARVSP